MASLHKGIVNQNWVLGQTLLKFAETIEDNHEEYHCQVSRPPANPKPCSRRSCHSCTSARASAAMFLIRLAVGAQRRVILQPNRLLLLSHLHVGFLTLLRAPLLPAIPPGHLAAFVHRLGRQSSHARPRVPPQWHRLHTDASSLQPPLGITPYKDAASLEAIFGQEMPGMLHRASLELCKLDQERNPKAMHRRAT